MLNESNISPNDTRSSQTAGRDAGTGHEGRLEAGTRGQLGAQSIPYGGHDDEAGLGQQRAQAIGSGHAESSCE
jgi:hypothetical protein